MEGKAFQFMTKAEVQDHKVIPRYKAILEWFAAESGMSVPELQGSASVRHPIGG
jgi:hypothetical protein